jgi:RNA polymerase sigma factor (sigma-70 family)
VKKETAAAERDETSWEDRIANGKESTEQTVVRASVMKAVRECIDRLKNEQERIALLLYYMGEKVYSEIAEVIGKSTSMARNRVNSAEEKVRRCLEGKGIVSMP